MDEEALSDALILLAIAVKYGVRRVAVTPSMEAAHRRCSSGDPWVLGWHSFTVNTVALLVSSAGENRQLRYIGSLTLPTLARPSLSYNFESETCRAGFQRNHGGTGP